MLHLTRAIAETPRRVKPPLIYAPSLYYRSVTLEGGGREGGGVKGWIRRDRADKGIPRTRSADSEGSNQPIYLKSCA